MLEQSRWHQQPFPSFAAKFSPAAHRARLITLPWGSICVSSSSSVQISAWCNLKCLKTLQSWKKQNHGEAAGRRLTRELGKATSGSYISNFSDCTKTIPWLQQTLSSLCKCFSCHVTGANKKFHSANKTGKFFNLLLYRPWDYPIRGIYKENNCVS